MGYNKQVKNIDTTKACDSGATALAWYSDVVFKSNPCQVRVLGALPDYSAWIHKFRNIEACRTYRHKCHDFVVEIETLTKDLHQLHVLREKDVNYVKGIWIKEIQDQYFRNNEVRNQLCGEWEKTKA